MNPNPKLVTIATFFGELVVEKAFCGKFVALITTLYGSSVKPLCFEERLL